MPGAAGAVAETEGVMRIMINTLDIDAAAARAAEAELARACPSCAHALHLKLFGVRPIYACDYEPCRKAWTVEEIEKAEGGGL